MTSLPPLRIATAADAAEIAEVTREAYSKWITVTGREPLPMRVDYADAVQRHRFDLMHLDGRLAALIETHPQDDRLLIVNVAVAPSHQGRGLGVRLLRHAEKLAVEQGLIGTRLYTNKLFSENVKLYLSLGYALEWEEELNGGVAVHMVKPTTP
jgi:GNAT superfamily N-acetyltransferase